MMAAKSNPYLHMSVTHHRLPVDIEPRLAVNIMCHWDSPLVFIAFPCNGYEKTYNKWSVAKTEQQ